MIRLLSIDDIILLHTKLIERTGGSHGVRDRGLVESANARALATFDGNDLYKTVDAKIAAITYALINNHGFIDGNKRIGITVMLLLARMNRITLLYSQDELVTLGLGIAESLMDEQGIIKWIEGHVKD